MVQIRALILAGGGERPLTSIKGRAMVEYVVEALCSAEKIGDIAIVGDVGKLKLLFGRRIAHYIQGGSSLWESLERGLLVFDADEHILVLSSDIPMINGDIIDKFIERCQLEVADIYYPIVEKSINKMQFPGLRRTYVKLKEGKFTGGNIICLNSAIFKQCENFAREAIANRKKPWKIGKVLGYRFLILLLLGQISICSIEQKLFDVLGVKGQAIISSYGEIVNDVDNLCDIEIISKFIDV